MLKREDFEDQFMQGGSDEEPEPNSQTKVNPFNLMQNKVEHTSEISNISVNPLKQQKTSENTHIHSQTV